MRATAILPVKRFGAAKQRVGDALDRPQRATIVRAMLDDVLAALGAAQAVERIIVVTGEGRAERAALAAAQRLDTPIEVLRDPADHGHSAAATLGIVRAAALGAECVALVPGDCPLLEADELDGVIERMRPRHVGVVPDRHGTGTNALILAPVDAIGPAFGPDSCARHLDRAGRAGHGALVEEVPSLALDLDTVDDLNELARVLAESPERAPETARAIERLGVAAAAH